jgi:hypothetical protein
MNAAKRLGCSVFDLMDRPDAEFWVACAVAAAEFEGRVQEDQNR